MCDYRGWGEPYFEVLGALDDAPDDAPTSSSLALAAGKIQSIHLLIVSGARLALVGEFEGLAHGQVGDVAVDLVHERDGARHRELPRGQPVVAHGPLDAQVLALLQPPCAARAEQALLSAGGTGSAYCDEAHAVPGWQRVPQAVIDTGLLTGCLLSECEKLPEHKGEGSKESAHRPAGA